MRHERIGAYLHYSICRALGIKTTQKRNTSKLACQHEDVTLLRNQEVHKDREVMENRPDIIIKKQKEIKDKTRILMEVAIPAGRNATQKHK